MLKGKCKIALILIDLVVKQMRYHPWEEFLLGCLAASPFAEDITAMEAHERQAMLPSIHRSFADAIDDQSLIAPMACYAVSAKRMSIS